MSFIYIDFLILVLTTMCFPYMYFLLQVISINFMQTLTKTTTTTTLHYFIYIRTYIHTYECRCIPVYFQSGSFVRCFFFIIVVTVGYFQRSACNCFDCFIAEKLKNTKVVVAVFVFNRFLCLTKKSADKRTNK